ncbi:methyl-accepting chemotaxis protein, partial [Piscinibacter sakaiensis]|uniref:methyl-accepting chemotaxis protein n=1 Tax=Piscinibacter sakaiensis TaxID=1547922 RepID=UPI0006B5511A
MTLLSSLSIGRRLALLLAVLVGFTVTVAAAGAWGGRALSQLTHQGLEVDVRLAQQAAEIRALVLLARRYEKDSFINAAEAGARDEYARRWESTRRQLQDALGAAGALASAGEDREALAAMAHGLDTYASGYAATLAELREGRVGDAAEANRHLARVKDAVRGMEAAAEALNQRALARAAGVLPGIEALGARLALLQGGLTLAVVALALVLGALVARSITRPIADAVRVADAVADGRLDMAVPAGGADETGRLLQALEHMRQGLVRLVGAMRDASSSIATGSSQIAQGNADLSQRTEAQAANLQQTAAAMEEINATADNNLEVTARAAALAADAERAAREGGSVTGRVVATMDRISESSRRITEIVGTIDGIA